ncbi:MAG: PEP-CTERM sorting domain-containing protein [Pirellulales bacterium]
MIKLLRLLAIGTSFLPLAGIRSTQAAEIKIVSPSAYEHIEGAGSAEGCCSPFRYQQVFPAADFAALGNKPHWLVDSHSRPDQSLTGPLTVHYPDNEYRLATTQRGPDNLSLRFDDNLGSDFKHWYRGPVTAVADVAGPGPGPREFYHGDRPAGVTPYLYDPSQGNLVLDVIGWQGVSPSPSVDKVPGIQTGLYASSPFATQGFRSDAGIYQFTFVPVLETPVGTWNVDAGGNWSLSANWASGVPNGTGAQAVLGSVITSPHTVTVDAPIAVGRLDFENANAYTIAGPQILTLDAMSGDAQINVASGSQTITAPVTLADNTTITVTPPASNLSLTGSLNASGRNLTKIGGGTLTVNNIRAAGLSVNGGAVAMATNGTNSGVSVLGTLSIAGDATPTAKLDLANNAAIINYTGASPMATVRQQILTGRGGPGFDAAWTGQGITSSAAAAAVATDPEARSVGYAENSSLPLGPYSTFRGQSVDDTSLLMAYTRTGDANLDGIVNDDDVTIVSATYAPGVPQPSWALGDFDYNGFVDDDDVTLLGAFYDPSAPPLMAAVAGSTAASAIAPVPEPSTLALLAAMAGALWLTGRRRRGRTALCVAT